MRSYDEITSKVLQEISERRARHRQIQYMCSISAVCVVCMLGLAAYLQLERPEKIIPEQETRTETIQTGTTIPLTEVAMPSQYDPTPTDEEPFLPSSSRPPRHTVPSPTESQLQLPAPSQNGTGTSVHTVYSVQVENTNTYSNTFLESEEENAHVTDPTEPDLTMLPEVETYAESTIHNEQPTSPETLITIFSEMQTQNTTTTTAAGITAETSKDLSTAPTEPHMMPLASVPICSTDEAAISCTETSPA